MLFGPHPNMRICRTTIDNNYIVLFYWFSVRENDVINEIIFNTKTEHHLVQLFNIKICMYVIVIQANVRILTVRVTLYATVLNHRSTNLSSPYFERTLSHELFCRIAGWRYRNRKKKQINCNSIKLCLIYLL